jgi:hypothetical protein
MRTHRFGQKIKLPATIAIKHQLRKLMFEDSVKKAEAEARAEAMRGQLREETRSLAFLSSGSARIFSGRRRDEFGLTKVRSTQAHSAR